MTTDIHEDKIATQIEKQIDMRRQINELDDVDESDFMFEDRTRRVWHTLYSTETGEPIPVIRYHLNDFLSKRRPDGLPMFTAHQSQAPEYKLGETKCFLAPGAPEEALVKELGIYKACKAVHLQNKAAARTHAEHKHKSEWRTLQEYLADVQAREDRERQDKQMEAMMALAGNAKRGPGRPPKEDE